MNKAGFYEKRREEVADMMIKANKTKLKLCTCSAHHTKDEVSHNWCDVCNKHINQS